MPQEKQLETLLHSLGKTERMLEKLVSDLMLHMRQAYQAGHTAEGDAYELAIAEAKQSLKDTKSHIAQVELQLYTLRRRKNR
ncbi:MAG: hypothetical protein WAX89_02525 [Alphaproteobacteria bacterium]